jgi:cell wall-associated NlpC family hydrolase
MDTMLNKNMLTLLLAFSFMITPLFQSPASAQTLELPSYAEKISNTAEKYVGKRKSGLNSVDFVSYVFDQNVMYVPPKHSEIGKVGHPISLTELEPGDIVYISKGNEKVWAAGIYVGDNEVVMANYHFNHTVHKIDLSELSKKFTVFARRVTDDKCTSCGPA